MSSSLTTGKLYSISPLFDLLQKRLPVITLDNDNTILHRTTCTTFLFQYFGKLFKSPIIKSDTEKCCNRFSLSSFDRPPDSDNSIV